MEQFNLQAYLKNPDRKIVTRDGRSARVVCTDRKSDKFPIVVLVEGAYHENICRCTKDGLFAHGIECDLFFSPEKKEGWINIYHYDGIENANASRRIFNTKEEALAGGNKGRIDTIKIEWEE